MKYQVIIWGKKKGKKNPQETKTLKINFLQKRMSHKTKVKTVVEQSRAVNYLSGNSNSFLGYAHEAYLYCNRNLRLWRNNKYAP